MERTVKRHGLVLSCVMTQNEDRISWKIDFNHSKPIIVFDSPMAIAYLQTYEPGHADLLSQRNFNLEQYLEILNDRKYQKLNEITEEQVLLILDQIKCDYTVKNRALKGLQIFAKYNDDIQLAYEHDIIYAESLEKSLEYLTEEDVQELSRLGWIIDTDSWAHY